MRITEARRLERLGAGTEKQREATLLLRPDQRVLRGVAGSRTWQREEVVLHPELRLLPGCLFGLGDQLVLACNLHIGNPLRQGGRLAVDGGELPLHLCDALAQPVLEVLLMGLLLDQRGLLVDEVGALLVGFFFLGLDQVLLFVELEVDLVDVVDQLVGEVRQVLDGDCSVEETLEVWCRQQLRHWVGVAFVDAADEGGVFGLGLA